MFVGATAGRFAARLAQPQAARHSPTRTDERAWELQLAVALAYRPPPHMLGRRHDLDSLLAGLLVGRSDRSRASAALGPIPQGPHVWMRPMAFAELCPRARHGTTMPSPLRPRSARPSNAPAARPFWDRPLWTPERPYRRGDVARESWHVLHQAPVPRRSAGRTLPRDRTTDRPPRLHAQSRPCTRAVRRRADRDRSRGRTGRCPPLHHGRPGRTADRDRRDVPRTTVGWPIIPSARLRSWA